MNTADSKSMLASTHPNFKRAITAIAGVAKMTPEGVFALWRQYSMDCQNSDQSALISEFVQWYVKQLGGDIEALCVAAESYYIGGVK